MKRSIDEIEAYEAYADAWREDLKLIADAKILVEGV